MPSYSLGRRYAPDERDTAYPFKLAQPPLPPRLPLFKFWQRGTPVLDQGQTPQCVAYAWKQWLMSSPIRQGQKQDPAGIYAQAQQEDEWPGEDYEGTSVRAGAKVLQQRGFIANYLWAHSIDEIRDWIIAKSPVVLGTNWYSEMFNGYWGEDRLSGFWVQPQGALVGGHAYLALGYSFNRRAFRCLNSWGMNWGQRGKFWIAEEHLAELLQQNGEACVAVEERLSLS